MKKLLLVLLVAIMAAFWLGFRAERHRTAPHPVAQPVPVVQANGAVSPQSPASVKAGNVMMPGSAAGSNASAAPPFVSVRPLYGTLTGSSTGTNVPARQTDEDSRKLSAALRNALARVQAQQLMTPAQRQAFQRLNDAAGGGVEVRMRAESGTPSMLEIPVPDDGSITTSLTIDEQQTVADSFLNTNRDFFRLSDPALELQLENRASDELKRSLLRYSQHYAGLAVWPAELMVHLDPHGLVDAFEGAYIATPYSLPTTPVIGADQAVAFARAVVPEGRLGKATQPQLIIYAPTDRSPRLGWKLELEMSSHSRWLAVIDANTGAQLATFNQVCAEKTTGSGSDLFHVSRTLNLWHDGINGYLLEDTSKPMFDPASSPPGKPKGAIIIFDANHTQSSANSQMSVNFVGSQ